MIVFEQQEGPILPTLKLSIKDCDKELGFYFLIPHADNIYEVHTHMNTELYGSAVELSKEAIKQVFQSLPNMDIIITKVPVNNPLAKRLSLSVGMKMYGTLPKSFRDVGNNLIDQEMFYISREIL